MNIILFGYYGYGNAGDEVALSAILERLREGLSEKINLIVLSHDPEATSMMHSVEAWSMKSTDVIRALNEGNVWVVGGGSILQDSSSFRSLLYYVSVLWVALRNKKPVFLFGQGIGPLKHRISQILAAHILKKSHRVSVRDQASRRLSKELGVMGNITLGADAAFLLKPPKMTNRIDTAKLFGVSLDPQKPTLGLSLRSWKNHRRWLGELSEGLKEFTQRHNVQIILLPMEDREDMPILLSVARKISSSEVVFSGEMDFRDKWRLLSCCQLVVGMRLHAIILASISGIKGVALSYDPKVDAMADCMDWPVLPVVDLKKDSFLQTLNTAWENRKKGKDTLQRVEKERHRAEEDLQGLIEELKQLGFNGF